MKLTIEPGFDVTIERTAGGTIAINFPAIGPMPTWLPFERRVFMGIRTLIAEFYEAEDRETGGEGPQPMAVVAALATAAAEDYVSDIVPPDDSPDARHHDEILSQINASNNVKP